VRSRYQWYLPPSQDEFEKIWRDGLLTLDANVLLDLYRYHVQTRDDILRAIKGFKNRVWMSDQASVEFIRNRHRVIASSEKSFKEAETILNELSENIPITINKLRGQRLVPRSAVDQLDSDLAGAVAKARETIRQVQSEHPNYLKTDDILTTILDVFDGRIGPPPSDEERARLHQEGERRKQNKIPPGYLDRDKEGERPYGDYVLWHQVITKAKECETPMILVTSERSEDWWEKVSGRTTGPRPEMIKEAFELSGRRVLIYQTDYFLEVASKQTGAAVPTESVAEIRELSAKSARGSSAGTAVAVEQNTSVADQEQNTGMLVVQLLRPVFSFTATGQLEPEFESPPTVQVNILHTPPAAPQHVAVARTGTTFDFNVHVRSAELGVPLPVGSYQIQYAAVLGEEKADSPADLPAQDTDGPSPL
jgi:hypothetical protein